MLFVEVDGEKFDVSYLDTYHGKMKNTVELFNDESVRVLAGQMEAVSSYYRREITIYSVLTKMLAKTNSEAAKPHIEAINKYFEVITRTPIIIHRKNSSSITAALANIAAISVALGKISEFVPFAQKVLEEGLYISQSSLEDYHGSGFIRNKQFYLPEGVDPYKATHLPESMLYSVYEHLRHKLTDSPLTHLTSYLIGDSDDYINEQLRVGLELNKVFIYPFRDYKTITDIIDFFCKEKDCSITYVINQLYSNDSIASPYSTIGLVKADAKLANALPLENFHYLCRFQVKDIDFLFALNQDRPIHSFNIDPKILAKSSKEIFTRFLSLNKRVPRNFIDSTFIVESNIEPPIEFFVANMSNLYFDSSRRDREYFHSKYSLQDIVNILH